METALAALVLAMQFMNKAEDPLVDIWMVTYNHENYIAEAIESVLMQQTNFNYRLVIGEDYSTDKTREICIEYQKKNPDKIHLILNKKNLGATQNSYNTHYACNAKYQAMLEGDDYWTDPLKLQKQVDFLEANKEFSLCFHIAEYVNTIENKIFYFPEKLQKTELTIEDVLLFPTTGWFLMTSTIVYRKSAILNLPAWFLDFRNGDCLTVMLASLHGKIYFLKEDMSIYRLNTGGIMQSDMFSNINVITSLYLLFRKFNSYSNHKFQKLIYKQLLIFLYEILLYYKNEKKWIHCYIYTIKFNYFTLRLKKEPKGIKEHCIAILSYARFLLKEVNTQ